MKHIAPVSFALILPALASAQTPGIDLYKQGKHAEAATALASEVQASPDNKELLTYLGLARANAGDPGGALDPLKKAISLDSEYAEAHFGLGLAFVKMKNLGEAVPELEKAVKLAPNHAYANYNLGMSYNEMGKRDLAAPHLRRFLELAPNAPEAPGVKVILSRL
jgi:Flp pilus assembly protein TadD